MSSEAKIHPYGGVINNEKKFMFGMTSAQLIGLDKKVFLTLRNNISGWTLERRSGYSIELVNDKMVAMALPLSNYNSIMVDDVDCSSLEKLEQLKGQYEHYIYSDGVSVLFPALGIVYLVTPFREGWETPRPNVFDKDLIAFSKERLAHYRSLSKVLTLAPLRGVSIAGGTPITFGMTQTQAQESWGEPELVWDESNGAHSTIKEYRFDRGVEFCYEYPMIKNKPVLHRDKNAPLHQMFVVENKGWQIEVDGIRIFQDNKLV